MARKKAQRKQETTLVAHRTPNLSTLLQRARTGDSARAVKAYLDAGGSAEAVLAQQAALGVSNNIPLLHNMALTNAHPHSELAESVGLLVAAGADINGSFTDSEGVDFTA
jgi:hypothetical protein